MNRVYCLLVCLFCACQVSLCKELDEKVLFEELDQLLAQQQELTQEKERKIKIIKEGLSVPSITLEQEYAINNRLYDEYLAFKYDSAYKYVNRNFIIAKQLNNKKLYTESTFNLVHILSVAGLFDHAYVLIDSIDVRELSGQDLQDYYQTYSDLVLFSTEFSVGTDFYSDNLSKILFYRKKLHESILDKNSLSATCNQAELLAWNGEDRKALAVLQKYVEKHPDLDGRAYSIIYSTMAFFYSKVGDRQMRKKCLLLSAISDVKCCIRENTSIRELASVLFDEGEFDRAYKYLNASVQDANFYGTRLRNAQVAQFVPKIIEKYYQTNNYYRRFLLFSIVVITSVAILLVVALIFMRRYLCRYRDEKEKVELANEKLNNYLGQLEKTNVLLKQHGAIKEQYIGRFMELVSVVIVRAEEQRKLANRLGREHKLEELFALLKSSDFVSENNKLFNTNFDEAFLNIYPDFVEQVNVMLLPEYQYPVDRRSLNTELRILAIIRLGIQDNQKIASILQSSITTIYTYRSKLKSRSIYKNDFEKRVMEIGA